MHLRDHPLMSYRGVPNWPPVWIQSRGFAVKPMRGEVGILVYVYRNENTSSTKCYLTIEHEHQIYVGTLLFDYSARGFGVQICKLLNANTRRTLKEIGDLEVGQLL